MNVTPTIENPTTERLPPWSRSFEILEENGGPADGDSIAIRQVTEKTFRLGCKVRYLCKTGLEGKISALRDQSGNADERRDRLNDVLEHLKKVDDAVLGETDLASVPRAMQWLVPRYGAHTPAALLHDRMIGKSPQGDECEIENWAADRFF